MKKQKRNKIREQKEQQKNKIIPRFLYGMAPPSIESSSHTQLYLFLLLTISIILI